MCRTRFVQRWLVIPDNTDTKQSSLIILRKWRTSTYPASIVGKNGIGERVALGFTLSFLPIYHYNLSSNRRQKHSHCHGGPYPPTHAQLTRQRIAVSRHNRPLQWNPVAFLSKTVLSPQKIINFATICIKPHHEPNTDDKTTKQDEESYNASGFDLGSDWLSNQCRQKDDKYRAGRRNTIYHRWWRAHLCHSLCEWFRLIEFLSWHRRNHHCAQHQLPKAERINGILNFCGKI